MCKSIGSVSEVVVLWYCTVFNRLVLYLLICSVVHKRERSFVNYLYLTVQYSKQNIDET